MGAKAMSHAEQFFPTVVDYGSGGVQDRKATVVVYKLYLGNFYRKDRPKRSRTCSARLNMGESDSGRTTGIFRSCS